MSSPIQFTTSSSPPFSRSVFSDARSPFSQISPQATSRRDATTRRSSANGTMSRRVDTIQVSSPVAPTDQESQPPPTTQDLSLAAAIAQKIADDEMLRTNPAPVLHLGGVIDTPFEYELEHQFARFTGLYVVNGPTASRHIRYAMEVTIPALQLRTRCIQRFQGFYVLRQRLLMATKCCGAYHKRKQQLAAESQPHNHGLFSTWQLPAAFPGSPSKCHACQSTRKMLKTLKFPRRKFFAAKPEEIEDRSFQLEAFLSACLRLLVEAPGCERGKKLFTAVVGKFLGVNLLVHLFPSQCESFSMANQAEVGLRGGSDGAMTDGLSSRSESSVSGFHVGAPSTRTLLSTHSSAASLSLHDGGEV
ncbi:hypothetical protein FI667_g10940, partial [Globisporangium splendens]